MKFSTNRGILALVGCLSLAVFLSACGDELTEITNSDTPQVATYKDLAKCTKKNEGEFVYVKDSGSVYLCTDSVWKEMKASSGDDEDDRNGKNGKNGTPCSIETLDDDSGYDVICDGKKVGQLLSADDGKKGKKGDKGDDGNKGGDGDKGDSGDNCTAKALKDGSGFELTCGGKVVGTIKNGENGDKGVQGASCTAQALKDKSGFEVSCGGAVVGTLKNGTTTAGVGCTFEDDGEGTITAKCGSDQKSVNFYKAVCGTTPYDPDVYACLDINIDENGYAVPVLAPLCGGMPYNPEDVYRTDNYIALALSSDSKQTCKDGVIYGGCGDKEYNTRTHFCAADKKVYPLCGKELEDYDPKTKVCKEDKVLTKCGESSYDPETHFCADDGNVYLLCGDELKTYDPETYYCKNGSVLEKVCDGCSVENSLLSEKGFTLKSDGIFEKGTATFTQNATASLMNVVDMMNAYPTVTFDIVVYTDNIGKKDANKALSEDQANAVKSFFVEKDIDESRMTTQGLGSANPVAPNITPEGRAENRRIEFIRTDVD